MSATPVPFHQNDTAPPSANNGLILIASLVAVAFTVGIQSGTGVNGALMMVPMLVFVLGCLFLLSRSPLQTWICLLPVLFLRTNVLGYFAWAAFLPILLAAETGFRTITLRIPVRQLVHIGAILAFALAGAARAGFSELAVERLLGTYLLPVLIYFTILKAPSGLRIESLLPRAYLLTFAFIGLGSILFKLQNPYQDRVAGYVQLSVTMVGYVAATLMPIAFHFIAEKKNQAFETLLLVLLLLAMLLTNTRMAIPMAAIAFLLNFRRFKRILIPLSVIFMIIAVIGYKIFFYRYFVMAASDSVDTSLLARLFAWNAAFQLIKENALFGIGMTNFAHIYQQITQVTVIDLLHSHNTILQKCLDLGIPGMLGYFSFILLRLKEGFRHRQDSLTSALLLCLAVYFLAGAIDSVFYMTEWTCFYWSVLACLVRRTRIIADNDRIARST